MSNSIFIKLFRLFNLKREISPIDEIHQLVESAAIFKGTNLWLLVFATVLASIGLNTNSTAVIIGAMLISPLMGPINAAGYSIATYDFELFRKAIKNLTYAVLASLTASSLYFVFTPVSTAHSELLARISPTIYDVMIAFFGGFAGMVAISTKNKGNVVPGVAIATALMPPICTAGYGLALQRYEFFAGAFYLFTINAVFIAISAMVTSKILKFPIKTVIEHVKQKKINRIVYFIIILTIIPSVIISYNLIKKEDFNIKYDKFLIEVNIIEKSYLIKNEDDFENKTIMLVYGGNKLTENNKVLIKSSLDKYGLTGFNLKIVEGLENNESVLKFSSVQEDVSKLKLIIDDKETRIKKSEKIKSMAGNLFQELSAIFPGIKSCNINEADVYSSDSGKVQMNQKIQLILGIDDKKFIKKDFLKITKWAQERLKTENLDIIFN